MTIKEATSRYEAMLNVNKENYRNLNDMSQAFLNSGRRTVNYEKSLVLYSRHRQCAQLARLMNLDGMVFAGLDDLEAALS